MGKIGRKCKEKNVWSTEIPDSRLAWHGLPKSGHHRPLTPQSASAVLLLALSQHQWKNSSQQRRKSFKIPDSLSSSFFSNSSAPNNVSDRFRYQETWQWKAPELLMDKVTTSGVYNQRGLFPWRLPRNLKSWKHWSTHSCGTSVGEIHRRTLRICDGNRELYSHNFLTEIQSSFLTVHQTLRRCIIPPRVLEVLPLLMVRKPLLSCEARVRNSKLAGVYDKMGPLDITTGLQSLTQFCRTCLQVAKTLITYPTSLTLF